MSPSDVKAKTRQIRFRQNPENIILLWRFTTLHETPWLDLRGSTSKEEEKEGRGKTGTGGQENVKMLNTPLTIQTKL